MDSYPSPLRKGSINSSCDNDVASSKPASAGWDTIEATRGMDTTIDVVKIEAKPVVAI